MQTFLKTLALALAALLFASAAEAVDFTQPILGPDDKPAIDPKAPDAGPVTLGAVISAALLSPPPGASRGNTGVPADPLRLARRAELALRVRSAKDAALTAEQIIEIKEAVTIFPPLTVLRVIQAIDPAALK